MTQNQNLGKVFGADIPSQPIVRKPTPIKPLEGDLIDSLTAFICSNVPTTREWAEDNAIIAVSSVMGIHRYLSTRIGRLHLNLFIIFIGPSGISWKTIPLKDYLRRILLKVTELSGNEGDDPPKDYLLPSSFSSEGMVEYMAKQAEGVIIRDEVSTLFKDAQGKNYSIDLLEFMSQLYDGMLLKRFTRKFKLEEVSECSTSFIGATTPYLYDVLDVDVFIQGLGNRILFEFWDEEIKDFTPEGLLASKEYDEERELKIEQFARVLYDLSKITLEIIAIDQDSSAGKLITSFVNEMNSKAGALYQKSKTDLRTSYYSRAGEMVMKLSALKFISRKWKSLKNTKLAEIVIEKQDIEWAIERERHYLANFDKLLDEWGKNPKAREPPISFKHTKENLLHAIEKAIIDHGFATNQDIWDDVGWYKCKPFYQMMATLEVKLIKMTREEILALPKVIRIKHGIEWDGTGQFPTFYKSIKGEQ